MHLDPNIFLFFLQQVAIVDTSNGFNVERRDMKAEAMLMHRERYVIAVRAAQGESATVIQVSPINFRLSSDPLIHTCHF